MTRAPLEDSSYTPELPPVDGGIPAVVQRWGPRSQLRWFERFHRDLVCPFTEPARQRHVDAVATMHVASLEHVGPCCSGCIGEYEETGIPCHDYACCCESTRLET